MRRREACLAMGALLLMPVASAAAAGLSDRPAAGRAEELRRHLALGDPESARAVARHLPRDAAIGRDPEESAGLLLAALGPAPDRQAVAAGIRGDFGAGRTLRCGGWTLSLTEARLCALWR